MDAPQAKASEKPANSADDDSDQHLAAHTANAEVPLPQTNSNANPAASSASSSPATQHASAVGQPPAQSGNVAADGSPHPPHQQVAPAPMPGQGGAGDKHGTGNPEEVVLFVSGFGYSLNDEGFTALFAPFGRVVSCKVLVDIPTGKSKGCGLIRLENKKAADAAIAGLHSTTLPGQVTSLTVKYADTPEEKSRRRNRQLMQTRFNPLARPGAPMPFHMGMGMGMGMGPGLATPPLAFPSVAVPPPLPAAGAAYPPYPPAPAPAAAGAGAGGAATFQQLQAMQEAAAYSTVPGQFTLYVGGLPQGIDEGTLYKVFSPYGAVAGVKIVMDSAQPTMNKGFCFVNFFRYEEACQAIYAVHNQQFGEKRLQVSFKTAPKAKGVQTMRHPGAATGGYTGPGAPAATPYGGYPAGGAAAYGAAGAYPGYTAPAAGAAGTQAYGGSAPAASAYQQFPYGGSYQ